MSLLKKIIANVIGDAEADEFEIDEKRQDGCVAEESYERLKRIFLKEGC